MHEGRSRQRRRESLELISLAFSIDQIDIERYMYFGNLENTGRGGPVKLTGETKRKVDAEMERIRREDPELKRIGKPK